MNIYTSNVSYYEPDDKYTFTPPSSILFIDRDIHSYWNMCYDLTISSGTGFFSMRLGDKKFGLYLTVYHFTNGTPTKLEVCFNDKMLTTIDITLAYGVANEFDWKFARGYMFLFLNEVKVLELNVGDDLDTEFEEGYIQIDTESANSVYVLEALVYMANFAIDHDTYINGCLECEEVIANTLSIADSVYFGSNVGIGTTAPSKELDVVGNINLTGDIYKNGAVWNPTTNQWTTSGSNIYYNDGNVGIGSAVPIKKLDVGGDLNLTGDIYKNGVLWTVPVSFNGGTITNGLIINKTAANLTLKTTTANSYVEQYFEVNGVSMAWEFGNPFAAGQNSFALVNRTSGSASINSSLIIKPNGDMIMGANTLPYYCKLYLTKPNAHNYIGINGTTAEAGIALFRNGTAMWQIYMPSPTNNDLNFWNPSVGVALAIERATGALTLMADIWHKSRDGYERFKYNYNAGSFYKSPTTHAWYNAVNATKMLLYDNGYFYINHDNGNYVFYDGDATRSLTYFTGQHRSFTEDEKIFKNADDYTGLIVVSTGEYVSETDKGIMCGKGGITINDAMPLIELSSQARQKSVYGVVSTIEKGEEREMTGEGMRMKVKKGLGEHRVIINALGEGAIWVCDENGSLENGDLICSSSIAGYGMKQDDDLMHNYTVAKITMACNFEPQLVPKKALLKNDDGVNILDDNGMIQFVGGEEVEYEYEMRWFNEEGQIITMEEYEILKEAGASVYRAAFVGCTYHCG